MNHAELARHFDAWATDGRAEALEARDGAAIQTVLGAMAVRPGARLLDLGCGVGWATRLLGKRAPGAQAIGIDLSPEMIRRAEALSDWTSRARFERMAFEALDFPDGRFGHVLASASLHCAVDLDRALGELVRVLAPGGTVEVLLDHFEGRPRDAAGPVLVDLPPAGWHAELLGAGFEVEEPRTLADAGGLDLLWLRARRP